MITVNQVTRNITVRSQERTISVNQSPRNIEVSMVGRRGPQGIQGIQGEQGEQGPPGSDAEDKNFAYDFINSAEVTVDHSLSKYPAVTIVDSSGDEVEAEVEHLSVNQLVARFSASFSGRVICNQMI